jgi:nucleoside-diphosphate kinase
LVDFLTSGEVVAMVLEGNAAVPNVRRLCGKTVPLFADPGSIRGRYSLDSPDLANAEKRPIYNLVHASGAPEEAQSEIQLWFPGL